MTKAIGHLLAILATSTICDNGIGHVSGFVTSSALQGRTRTNHATKSPDMNIPLNYSAENDGNYSPVAATGSAQIEIVQLTKRFKSPVLIQHCGEILEWKETYGHPNIPLKNDGGNACQVLRRLRVQNKLTDEEVEWLEEIGFRFHSLEDVYRFADFDKLLDRLMAYEETHPNNNFQVPKKCPEDPELGAWVTGIRRLGTDGVNPDHERRLTAIHFVWQSTRKCGSKFMNQFREWTEQVELKGVEAVLEDPNTINWIIAQQLALKRGTLSQARVQYMGQLFGETWTTIGKENGNSDDDDNNNKT
jgi:hypothetical protein